MLKRFHDIAILLCLMTMVAINTSAQSQNADKVATKDVNSIRFANQFNGDSGTHKQDAAISDIGGGPGLVIDVPGTGSGGATTYKNNIPILDLRQSTDVIFCCPVKWTSADRVSPFLIENHIGDYNTRPLTGKITLANGSTEVVGSGTSFITELNGGTNGSLIKLNTDGGAYWARIAKV